MTHYLLKIDSKENFVLYCSLFDWYNGFIFNPEMLEETEKGFSYQTAVVYGDYHRLRIEVVDGKESIKVLNGLYEVDDDCPRDVLQNLDYDEERVFELYLRQRFIIEDMGEIKAEFNFINSKYKDVSADQLTYNDALRVLVAGKKAITRLRQLHPLAKGITKETIDKYIIDILEKSYEINAIVLTNVIKAINDEVPI